MSYVYVFNSTEKLIRVSNDVHYFNESNLKKLSLVSIFFDKQMRGGGTYPHNIFQRQIYNFSFPILYIVAHFRHDYYFILFQLSHSWKFGGGIERTKPPQSIEIEKCAAPQT